MIIAICVLVDTNKKASDFSDALFSLFIEQLPADEVALEANGNISDSHTHCKYTKKESA